MPTYLLNWNPTKWPWDELSREASEVAAGKIVRRHWSTGVRKDVPVGSRLFILRQGVEPRGIVASGDAVGIPIELDHFDPEKAAAG